MQVWYNGGSPSMKEKRAIHYCTYPNARFGLREALAIVGAGPEVGAHH
jgi:hypothetical protein